LEPQEFTNNSVEKANKIVNAILEHLDTGNCDHCKALLKRVFEP